LPRPIQPPPWPPPEPAAGVRAGDWPCPLRDRAPRAHTADRTCACACTTPPPSAHAPRSARALSTPAGSWPSHQDRSSRGAAPVEDRRGPPGLAEADRPVASRAGASRAHEPVASRARAPVAERARGRTPALVPSQAPLPAERSRRGLERPYPRWGRAAAYPRAMSRTPHADACWEPARVPRGPHRGLSVPVPSTQPTPESAIAGAERPAPSWSDLARACVWPRAAKGSQRPSLTHVEVLLGTWGQRLAAAGGLAGWPVWGACMALCMSRMALCRQAASTQSHRAWSGALLRAWSCGAWSAPSRAVRCGTVEPPAI
jgi:hypothetical protein